MTKYIVEWTVAKYRFSETFDTLALATIKQIQLDAFGISSIIRITGL